MIAANLREFLSFMHTPFLPLQTNLCLLHFLVHNHCYDFDRKCKCWTMLRRTLLIEFVFMLYILFSDTKYQIPPFFSKEKGCNLHICTYMHTCTCY